MAENKLIKIAEEHGLEENKVQTLMDNYGKYIAKARELVQGAMDIKVKDADDFETMDVARERRLQLRAVRIDTENTRKGLKEQSLREGRAIDGAANIIKALIEPVEEHLMTQEKFAELLAKQEKDKVEQERISKLSKFVDNLVEGYALHPDTMSSEVFDALLNNSGIAYDTQKKAETEAEKLRKKVEADKEAEEKRIREENKELKRQREKEKVEKEKLARKLKAKEEAEAKAKKDKADQEAKAKKEEEEIEAKKKEQERKEALAPDKEKILLLADQVAGIELPAVKDEKAMKILVEFKNDLKDIENSLREKVNEL